MEGAKKFEDILSVHAYMKEQSQKSVEELHKCAVGLSENAACILALLASLREQASSPIPVLNRILLKRLSTKLTTYEVRLHVLDLSRESMTSGWISAAPYHTVIQRAKAVRTALEALRRRAHMSTNAVGRLVVPMQ